MTRVRFLGLLGAFAAACANPLAPPRYDVRSEAVNDFGSDADGRGEAWLRYARARAEGPPGDVDYLPAVDPPPFDHEVHARSFMARVWSELAAKRGYADTYLEALAAVQDAGYMREYTWQCLHVLRGLEPKGLRRVEFQLWLERELPGHVVETWATGRSDGAVLRFVVGQRAHAPYTCDPAPRS